MSYGIVEDHGGTIDFESTPARGTRVFFRLPVPTPGKEPTLGVIHDGEPAAVAGR